MALIRWQPFAEVETMRRQMDQMFDEIVGLDRQTQAIWQPAVELQDTADKLILRAEIPGIEGKDLDIRVTREAVVVSGEHRYQKSAQERGLFRSEFRYGKFQRVIALPVAIENNQVEADVKNGILTLTLPKASEARNKVVKVNLADTTATPDVNAASTQNQQNTETATAQA